MRKGLSTLEQVGIAILVLALFFSLAYLFTTYGKKIFLLTDLAFGPSEELCERTGLGRSSYQAKLALAENDMTQQTAGTPSYLEMREKIVSLYEEYERCHFPGPLTLAPATSLAIGRFYAEKGNAAAAIPHYESYLAQLSGKAPIDVLNELYRLYRDTKNHERALAVLQRIVAENPDTKDGESAQYRTGLYYETELNDTIKAKAAYQKLVDGKYFAELAQYSLAKIAFEKEKPIPYPEILSPENIKQATSLMDAARTLAKKGKDDEAIAQWNRIVLLGPNTMQGVLAQYEVGHLHRQRHHLPQALEALAKVPPYGKFGQLAALEYAETKLDIKGLKKAQ